ncbi:hypothetical protein [Hoyosella subflava]|uniref:hypothetical protein n=1 Tax=Hoyosella subflava TaxID=639313 RepID=UPI0011D1F83F|nr:hypothetical protein [Hoyosella subflava]
MTVTWESSTVCRGEIDVADGTDLCDVNTMLYLLTKQVGVDPSEVRNLTIEQFHSEPGGETRETLIWAVNRLAHQIQVPQTLHAVRAVAALALARLRIRA